MKEMQNSNYENFVEKINEQKNKVMYTYLEIGCICYNAKKTLGTSIWKKWLADSRVNLQISQAKKFIKVYKCYKDKSQSTGFLENRGIEHAYLLTRIKDEERRNEAENLITKENLSVAETKKIVKQLKQNTELTCEEAFDNLKNTPKKVCSEKIQTISLEEYNSLKKEYEALLKEKEELENKIRLLEAKPIVVKESTEIFEKPVKTTAEEGTINKNRHSIVVSGFELPIPPSVNIDVLPVEVIKMSAVNHAKNIFGLKIDDAVADTPTGIK